MSLPNPQSVAIFQWSSMVLWEPMLVDGFGGSSDAPALREELFGEDGQGLADFEAKMQVGFEALDLETSRWCHRPPCDTTRFDRNGR